MPMTGSEPRCCPRWLQPLVVALQLLTRLPMPDIGRADAVVVGRSLLCYPLVGALIGLWLWLLQGVLQWLWPEQWGIQAALLLLAWCLSSGGLHLDGLADSADAWVGGYGDRTRTLALMKDPTCGPVAVVVLVVVLLCKYAALSVLLAEQPWWLMLAPLVGRSYLLLLFLSSRYVRAGGLGDVLSRHFPKMACGWLLLLLAIGLLLSGVAGVAGVAVLVLTLGVFWGLRRMMIARLGGFTGDTAGALVELIEATVLLALLV